MRFSVQRWAAAGAHTRNVAIFVLFAPVYLSGIYLGENGWLYRALRSSVGSDTVRKYRARSSILIYSRLEESSLLQDTFPSAARDLLRCCIRKPSPKNFAEPVPLPRHASSKIKQRRGSASA